MNDTKTAASSLGLGDRLSLTAEDFASMATARSGLYAFLAGLCAKPTKKDVEGMLERCGSMSNGGSLPAEVTKALEALREFDLSSLGKEAELALQVDWTRLFRGVAKGYSPPPPYESVYREGTLQGQATSALTRAYAEKGMAVPQNSMELPDYIGVELGFMSRLAEKEAKEWRGEGAKAIELINDQRKFAREHLQSWVPRFCVEAKKLSRTEFYKAALKLLKSVLEWDASLLEGIGEAAAQTVESIGPD